VNKGYCAPQVGFSLSAACTLSDHLSERKRIAADFIEVILKHSEYSRQQPEPGQTPDAAASRSGPGASRPAWRSG